MTHRTVRIFQPARSAMQAGRRGTRDWIAEVVPTAKTRIDPLMGWAGADDTAAQIRLRFPTRDAALAWAGAQGHTAIVEEPRAPRLRPASYADNFRPGRAEPWTH